MLLLGMEPTATAAWFLGKVSGGTHPKLLWPLLGSLFFLPLKNSHCAPGQTIGDTQPKWRWVYREMGVPVREKNM